MSSYKQTEFDLQLSHLDSHARTSVSLANKQVSMETAVVSGRRLFGSSKMYGQRGQLLKMYLPFDLRGLPWSFKISARSGISVNGIAFPLVQLTRLTRETASGLLPTVTQDSKSDRHKRYDQGGVRLTLYVQRGPTPTAMDGRRTGKELDPDAWLEAQERHAKKGVNKHFHLDIAAQFEEEGRIWPTPQASRPWSRPNGKGGKVLIEEVLIEEGLRKRGENIEALKDTSESSSEQRPRGSLNPTLVEWLMGFPTGWTDLSS